MISIKLYQININFMNVFPKFAEFIEGKYNYDILKIFK